VQWDIDIDRIAMLVLCLTKADSAVADVLAAEARRIFAPAGRVPQQIQC
jgi:hypothetical protein